MGLPSLGISEGEALRDDPARPGHAGGGDQIARALDAKPGVLREHLGELRRIEHLRQIGELMNDDVGLHPGHRIVQSAPGK